MRVARLIGSCFLVASLVYAGCTSSAGEPDGGTGTGTATGTATGTGTPDAGDGKCHADTECTATQYCDLDTGACLKAKACRDNTASGDPSGNGECDYQLDESNTDYCAGGRCFCDLERGGGTCRPRFKLCQSCARDVECGNDPGVFTDYVATCASDKAGARVCLPVKPQCQQGYVPADGSGNNCWPGGGACANTGFCTRDSDCDPKSGKPICDVGRGFCTEPCVYDFQTGMESTETPCPSGMVCHVVAAFLTPDNPNFGAGKCGRPCDAPTNPTTCGTGLACEPDGSRQVKRCRPPKPKCVDRFDCPPDPATHSKGYCDAATLTCKPGCKVEDDCDSGYYCIDRVCTKKSCIENGGASGDCRSGQFCCGETNSPEPCPNGVNRGQCYDPPSPPWCAACSGVGGVQTPAGSARPQPSRCVKITDDSGQQVIATQIRHACDPAIRQQCPSTWICNPSRAEVQFCNDDAECGGVKDSCATIQIGQGIFTKGCTCDKTAGAGCPSPSWCGKDENGAFTGVCVANWCPIEKCPAP